MIFIEQTLMSYVHSKRKDWFDPNVFARRVKIDYPIECAMISDSQGVHPKIFSAGDQVGNTANTIQHAVFGVNVKVSEHLPAWPPH